MTKLLTFLLLAAAAVGMASTDPDEWNVNSRYTVERIDLPGLDQQRLSRTLREEIQKHVGQKFNPTAFAQLAGRVRDEVGARFVKSKLLRGSSTDQVKVVLEITGRRLPREVAPPSSFAWHGNLGWSGNLTTDIKDFYIGITSDQNASTERFAGLQAGYSGSFWKDRVRPSFHFSTFHSQFASSTLLAAAGTDALYHNHQTFQPMVTLIPWRGFDREELQVSSGFRSQRFVPMSPGMDRSFSQALVNSLRYQRLRGQDQAGGLRNAALTAEYSLIAGLSALSSDFAFRKQEAVLEAEFQPSQRSVVRLSGRAGRISGTAPLWDRFAYGNAQVMRGWSKLHIAPLGATRAAASSVEVGRSQRRYTATAFYDLGALWNQNQAVVARHSVGGGLRTKGGYFLYLAFPLRSTGTIEPVLMTGATF